jgi:hypothetical protein
MRRTLLHGVVHVCVANRKDEENRVVGDRKEPNSTLCLQSLWPKTFYETCLKDLSLPWMPCGI